MEGGAVPLAIWTPITFEATALQAQWTTPAAAWLTPHKNAPLVTGRRRGRRGRGRKAAYELTFTDPPVSAVIAWRTTSIAATEIAWRATNIAATTRPTACTGANDLIARTTA